MSHSPPTLPDASTAPPAKATRREWFGLAVIALPCLVYAMDLTVLNLAVPALSRALVPSASQLLWIIDIYGFFVAGFLITMGTLGDRIGRRRLLLIGAAFFAVASVLAAFARTPTELIVLRALLGIAGATLAPSTLSLIRNMFHDETQRQFAIGVWITAFSVGSAIGPLVGGWLLEHFWWGSVFLIAVPVMVLLLVLGPVLLPEFRDEHAGRDHQRVAHDDRARGDVVLRRIAPERVAGLRVERLDQHVRRFIVGRDMDRYARELAVRHPRRLQQAAVRLAMLLDQLFAAN